MNLITELSTYTYADLTRIACIARNRDERVPKKIESVAVCGAFRIDVKYDEGEIPRKKPVVTTNADSMTDEPGVLRVWMAVTVIVIGSASPRAIFTHSHVKV